MPTAVFSLLELRLDGNIYNAKYLNTIHEERIEKSVWANQRLSGADSGGPEPMPAGAANTDSVLVTIEPQSSEGKLPTRTQCLPC